VGTVLGDASTHHVRPHEAKEPAGVTPLPPRPPAPVGSAPPTIAVIGSITGIDFALADAVIAAGVPATVLRGEADGALNPRSAALYPHLSAADIVFFRSKNELLRLLREYDVVFSFTAALGMWLGRRIYLYPLLRRLGWPPYINMATGSDVAERALEPTREGRIQRFTMRHAFAQGLPPFPDVIRTAASLRLGNVCMLPLAHISPLDGDGDPHAPPPRRFRRSADEFLIFSPSRFDWGEADPGPRASTKGNDRFIRALARFARESPRPVHAVLLDRGADRENAKALVGELGLDEIVTWGPSLDRDELFAAMFEADLVVDQFDVGAFGLTALEAFQVGRPVLTYVDETCERLVYDESSPVLNAHTEDEILARLREAAESDELRRRTESARRWAHGRSFGSLLPRYLLYATLATGKPAVDFGWKRPHGTLESYDKAAAR
jgi:glycosyltransferase involved in cell wall biosynthesis